MTVIVGFGLLMGALLLLVKKAETSVKPIAATVSAKDEIENMISYAAAKYGVEAALIKAVAMTESSLNPNAVNPMDPSYGLMQIMPILAEDFGIVKDWRNVTEAEIAMIKDPQTNLRIGAWHLKRLTSEYPLDVALQMYNVGVSGYKNGKRAVDYANKVLRYYNEYRSNSVG